MFASAILHAAGFVAARGPLYVLIPCFIALGAFVAASCVSPVFALVAAALSGEDAGKTIAAFAPGGVETMSTLAFVIGLDPAFVAAHPIVRFFLIGLLLPFAARLLFGPAAAREGHAV